jgi:deoxyribonuclease-4
MQIGVHCPISGGYDNAVSHLKKAGGNTMQIFSGNPRGWQKNSLDPKKVYAFKNLLKKQNIAPLVIHAPYLINIVSTNEEILMKSINALKEELIRADMFNADYFVLHPGNNRSLPINEALKKAASALEYVLDEIKPSTELLIENTAGQKGAIGSDFSNLLFIRKELQGKINFCIDTAHAFQAGYSIEEILTHDISKYARLVHLNDSKTLKGSHHDRHQHIGQGTIGIENFRKLINHPLWKNKPFILETPFEEDMDRKNIELLKSLRIN